MSEALQVQGKVRNDLREPESSDRQALVKWRENSAELSTQFGNHEGQRVSGSILGSAHAVFYHLGRFGSQEKIDQRGTTTFVCTSIVRFPSDFRVRCW